MFDKIKYLVMQRRFWAAVSAAIVAFTQTMGIVLPEWVTAILSVAAGSLALYSLAKPKTVN